MARSRERLYRTLPLAVPTLGYPRPGDDSAAHQTDRQEHAQFSSVQRFDVSEGESPPTRNVPTLEQRGILWIGPPIMSDIPSWVRVFDSGWARVLAGNRGRDLRRKNDRLERPNGVVSVLAIGYNCSDNWLGFLTPRTLRGSPWSDD